MMGTAGQPGPISSRSSNVDSSNGPVTDRQLRKKADGVCRSLTELCLALSEGAGVAKAHPGSVPLPEDTTVTSPTITQFPGFTAQRRPSVHASRAAELTSPRTVSRFEDKRAGALSSSALPSSRYSSNIFAANTDAPVHAPGSTPTAARKASLLFSRTRRAGTEEPEDGRRTSIITRSRRAGTEEPEDHSERKPILTRGRRATIDDSEDEHRFRTPSRAVTEVNGARTREYISHLPPPPSTREMADVLAHSALPRKRLGSTTLNTRLAQATTAGSTMTGSSSSASVIATPSRRYFDLSTPGREMGNDTDRLAEERAQQRQFSLARSGSLNRRAATRQSMIATPSTHQQQQAT
ncbi:hypothetical protein GGS20DRAFT_527070 [Poronia punctata]|nr:hypothetical protein GGS20DRAFT_527070 [Poronia punctata]